ncbi:unnamed protein product [Clavelina lepadiformis]|uniref:Uncharacterized protein n=1 Tax=Clavelina lepadiformis TaxID=159417 RepID=A0ABP0FTW8_CLALP
MWRVALHSLNTEPDTTVTKLTDSVPLHYAPSLALLARIDSAPKAPVTCVCANPRLECVSLNKRRVFVRARHCQSTSINQQRVDMERKKKGKQSY